MFERFTDSARKATVDAQAAARRLGHGHIGTEHILLGLVREGEGLAMLILTRLGAGPEAIRARVLDALRQTG